MSKSFEFDFNKGDFNVKDGKVVKNDNIEALKIWITKVLKTEKFRFDIYKQNGYGVTLLELITSNLPIYFIKSEIEREIKEILLSNKNITNIKNINFERNKRTLKVSFGLETVFNQNIDRMEVKL